MIYTYTFKSLIGDLTIYEENEKIVGLLPKGRGNFEPNLFGQTDLLYEAYTQLREYFSGERTEFDLPTEPKGTEFQRKVWNELEKIPYGKTVSYQDLAGRIGNPKASRAVGGAGGKNPIMIIIPCHRVINKNGEIGGYAWGIQLKQYLLELEKANFGKGRKGERQ